MAKDKALMPPSWFNKMLKSMKSTKKYEDIKSEVTNLSTEEFRNFLVLKRLSGASESDLDVFCRVRNIELYDWQEGEDKNFRENMLALIWKL